MQLCYLSVVSTSLTLSLRSYNIHSQHGSPGKPTRAAERPAWCFAAGQLQMISGLNALDLCFLGLSLYLSLTYRLDCWIAGGKMVIHSPQTSQWIWNERESEQGSEGFGIATTNQLVTHLNIKQMGCLISSRICSNTENLPVNLLFIIKDTENRRK